MPRTRLPIALILLACSTVAAGDNLITPALKSVTTVHAGKSITIYRGHDRNATLPEIFQKTDRGCPPFCVQPMVAAEGVETIGELEVLEYLERIGQGDSNLMVIDSRTPDWVMRGTIPGSVNVPWNKISRDTSGTFETPAEADVFNHILEDEFGADRNAATGAWDFSQAKTLVLFCNGIWCPQSTSNLKTLVGIGYPPNKLKWYRGGMQDWMSLGLTTVRP